MSKTVVGLFSSTSAAQAVQQQLVSNGISSGDIRIAANDHAEHYGAGEGAGVGEKISHFFKNLTGGDDDAHSHYANGVNQGGALLTVKTDDDQASDVADMLRENGARNIEGDTGSTSGSRGYGDTGSNTGGYTTGTQDLSTGAAGTGVIGTGYNTGTGGDYTTTRDSGYDATTGSTGYDASRTGTTGEQAIPVIEENLVVGKREVDRGGVRVYSHVVETPVSTDVNLREENVLVERRAVDRAATADDFVSGRTIELRATGEEAVVGKTSRVVEEVLVGKNATERTEAINDSVRRTEVEVEQIPGSDLRTDTTNKY
ncbi:YsnF/AvaK domain-containing protein [Terriglobus sp.]|uniref:YsnF/AvaK domain-containing protein n=1 Tax=Terriglobus sp. TaxID=1889013 RepID=UPI003AFFCCE4